MGGKDEKKGVIRKELVTPYEMGREDLSHVEDGALSAASGRSGTITLITEQNNITLQPGSH